MAFGDIGGPVTELIVTCRTPSTGTVAIQRGDALVLTGNYTVDHAAAAGAVVVGQALVDCDRNSAAIPVRLRGVCEFAYTGTAPTVGGAVGIVASATAGKVAVPGSGSGRGLVFKVDTTAVTVQVLL
jgi:hypothetical protein